MKKIEIKLPHGAYYDVVSHESSVDTLEDTGLQEGDVVVIKEVDGDKLTGNQIQREIRHIFRDNCKSGYCTVVY